MDRQIAVLRALGRLSGPRKEPVNGDQLSRAIGGIASATVILSNRFFADAGWIVTSGRGLYAATDALVEYTRRIATGAADPAEVLRAPARGSWFWGVLEPYLADGGLAVNEATILLMREADATESHAPMIQNLIAWLEQVGLITVRDDIIVAGEPTPAPAENAPQAPPEAERPASGASAEGSERPAVQGQALPPEPLIAFGLDVQLTVADLAVLTPEQIKAFFEAVGAMAALKNRG
jgi:hypothetical protein